MDDQQQQHEAVDRACQRMELPILLERGYHLTIVTENGTRYRIIAASDSDIAVLDDIEAVLDGHRTLIRRPRPQRRPA